MREAFPGTSEVAIFGRILEPNQATLDAAAARAILVLDFKEADKVRMRLLLAKAKAGTLGADEEIEMNNYERRRSHVIADEVQGPEVAQGETGQEAKNRHP